MSSTHDEGYIKYAIHWSRKRVKAPEFAEELIACRNELFKRGLIGVYPDGIGFGNISHRLNNSDQFIITATQTGNIPGITKIHLSKVTQVDLNNNRLYCEGLLKASSEAMTHGAIYSSDKSIKAIIHVHNTKLWESYLHKLPTVEDNLSYGTPELASEIIRMLHDNAELKNYNIILTAGHHSGIFTFGRTIKKAFDVLMQYFNQSE
jgi:ribulose-5-phosphate 4-epimerase/fuculose-1-phosphate aldolase